MSTKIKANVSPYHTHKYFNMYLYVYDYIDSPVPLVVPTLLKNYTICSFGASPST